MPGFKMGRVTSDIKYALSEIFSEVKDPRISKLLSIVKLDISGDMSYAKIYVSVMGSEEEKTSSLEALKNATGFIKRELGLRLNLRGVPHPTFVLDRSIDYGAHISDLISKINKD